MALKFNKFIKNYHLVIVTNKSLHLFVDNQEHILKFDPSYFFHQEITNQIKFKEVLSNFLFKVKFSRRPLILALTKSLLYQQDYDEPSPTKYQQFFSTIPFDNILTTVVNDSSINTAYAANADLITFLNNQFHSYFHTKFSLIIPLSVYQKYAIVNRHHLQIKSLQPFTLFSPDSHSFSTRFPSINPRLLTLIIILLCLFVVLAIIYFKK